MPDVTTTEPEVFTPLNQERSERLRFDRRDVEVLSGDLETRGLGHKARVRIDGKEYDVIGANCDLPNCACDAFIKEVS